MSKTARQMLPAGVTYYSNRDEFLKATGRQAPPFMPELQPRLWGGPNKDGSYPQYKTLTAGGLKDVAAIPSNNGVQSRKANVLIEAFLGPQPDAFGVNMPGHYAYTSWEQWRLTRASSGVMVTFQLFGFDRTAPVPIEALFTAKQAAAVAAEIGQGAKEEEATDWNGQKATYTYPAGEQRRVWSIRIGQMLLALSALFRQRSDSPAGNTGFGIGAPGEWIVADGGAIFKAVATDAGESRTDYVPAPSVDLAADEEVAMEAMSGMPVLVVRKKGEAAVAPMASGTGGGLTAEEHGWLKDVWLANKLMTERLG